MAQQVKAHAGIPEFNPGTNIVKGENQFLKIVLTSTPLTHTVAQASWGTPRYEDKH